MSIDDVLLAPLVSMAAIACVIITFYILRLFTINK